MSTIEITELSNQETPETKPARKLRVCHLSLTLCTGGLERLLVDFARFYNSDLFELEFVALGETGAPAEDIQKLGCPVIQFPLTAPGKLGRIRQLQEFFKEKNYDLLHTHNAYPHFYGTLAGRLAGIPAIVQTRHGRRFGNTFNERLQFALASRLADRVIPVSDDTGNRCREVGWLSQSKVTRIWNGIDVDRFAFSGPAAQMRAITVSRLSPEKDLATLLKAVRLVKETIPEFELMIVGDGPERKKLEQITAALHLESRVRFLGERNDVPDLLTQAGFYVSSSLTEGISLTLLEAMSVGLPIVATSVGGNPEIVQQPDTGLLVPSANAALLSDAICEMCSQPDKWLAMGQAARERVEQHFNVRSMIKDYEDLYHQILNLQIK
ncbi:Putative glycosyltransferase EpsF [Gimesia panareensis]|uniref:Glycosyltransferase EpsF n=1 Tax=Gimesia panareensis TaxID=2527978 RepID=A0A518FQS7_9PLAN|nr:glycosyltransferase [Gimesia panareensis]QDV18620.1 Putative glycosyltransferase EpsF [Gimesia panareensis]